MSTQTPQGDASSRRREIIQLSEEAKVTRVVPGVEIRPLVGRHNGAIDLFTSLLTVDSQKQIPFYTRTTFEVLTLLEGEAFVDVEERRYRLAPLDSITLPPRIPRRFANPSNSQGAVFHLAIASALDNPTWVNAQFTPVDQPMESDGTQHHERIRRNHPAERFELAPGAMFQDFFNAELGSAGICGGYGLFAAGSRLPCHRHEFDESITIIQGIANCIVEGNEYQLSNNATALVPEGRCHYFINPGPDPMAMIWVYAGDMPDRILVDEVFCHPRKAESESARG
jgi:quercetin dioxygenase-like cupin family protein